MDYAQTAGKLASKGRYGDSMLVHMNPTEVAIMDRMTPGGLTTNPQTRQPEAFACLIPLLTQMVAPSLMARLGLTGTGALLGSAARGGLADYAVNGDPGKALGSALLGFGMGGLGNALGGAKGALQTGTDLAKQAAVKGTEAAAGAAGAQAGSAASGAMQGVSGGLSAAMRQPSTGFASMAPAAGAAAQTAANPMSGLMTAIRQPGQAFTTALRNPLTIGAPLAAGIASLAQPAEMQTTAPRDNPYDGDYARERFPGERTRVAAPRDLSRYGIDGGEHLFFKNNNDRRAAPPTLGSSGLGAYANAPGYRPPSGYSGRYGSLPGFAEGGGLGMRHGKADSVVAALSDGEYIVPADVVSKIGGGSTNGGFDWLDGFVAQMRSAPAPQGTPPRTMAAAA